MMSSVAIAPACRLALVPWKTHEPPVRAVWQRRLATIGPSPEHAGDSRNVRRVVLDQ
jgi:hypothetical protein